MRKPFLFLSVLVLLILLLAVINIGIGEFFIAPRDVLMTLLGQGEPRHAFIINTLRLPRVLVALLVGAELAVAGVLLQAMTRNPLASPGIIGLNAGAGLTAVAVIVLIPTVAVSVVPWAAFLGAAVVGVSIYLLAWKNGFSRIRLVLVGLGVSAIAQALIQMILIEGKISLVTQATTWMVGSVYARGWEHFWPLFPWAVILLPAAFLMSKHLDVILLGDDVARGLGSKLEVQRWLLLLIAVGLAGSAVATAGTIGFVGLMAPHLARVFVGTNHRLLIPASALTGAALLLSSDLIGRTAFAPVEIPCGVITTVVGAPYFLYLMAQTKR